MLWRVGGLQASTYSMFRSLLERRKFFNLNDQMNEFFIYSLLYVLLLIFQNWSHEKRYQQITLTLLIAAERP